MLRCLMPPVRAVGGRGSARLILRTTPASRFASKLTAEGAAWSSCKPSICFVDPGDALDDKKPSTAVSDVYARCAQVPPSDRSILPYASTQSGIHPQSTPDVDDTSATESTTGKLTSPTKARAITVLKAFLSTDNLASPTPTVHTANTIQSLYRSARARHQTKALDSREYSALISLFGSLSLSTPGQPYCSIYAHPFTAAILEKAAQKADRPYWGVVTWLVREKVSARRRLAPSDHYYSMCAYLADLLAAEDEIRAGGLPPKCRKLLRDAYSHYESLAKSALHPAAHLPYLRTLLRLTIPVDEAMDATRTLISRQSYSSPELLGYVWQLVSISPSQSTAAAKSALLHSLSSRAQRTIGVVAAIPLPDTPDASQDTQLLAVDTLLQSLVHAISCDVRRHTLAQNRHSYLLRWSLEAVLSELSLSGDASNSSDVAWCQLRYLAAAHTYNQMELEDLVRTDAGGSWSWKAVCVLSRIGQLLDVNDSADYYYGRLPGVKPESLRNVLKTLWNHWSANYPSEPSLFRPISPVIVVAFLRLARRVEDQEFAESAWSFLKQRRLLSDRAVAVEYCIAGIIGGLDVRQVLPAVVAHVLPTSRSTVVTEVIARLATVDLTLAHKVLTCAEESRITVGSDALASVAFQLVQVNRLEEALVIVSDERLQALAGLDILTAILQQTFRVPSTYPIRRLFVAISRRVAALVRSQQPPAAAQEALEETLLVALTVHRPPRLPSIVKTFHSFWPRFFSRHFLCAAAEELIRQRQFHTAHALLRYVPLHDQDRRRIVLTLVRNGADRLAFRFLRRHAPSGAGKRTSSLDTLVRATRLNQNKTSRLRMINFPRSMLKSLHPAEAAYAMKLFASAGRASAGKLLYDARHRLPPALDRTVIANTLIHASMANGSRRRRARQLKRTLEVMNRLVHEQGFTPDRVTVNILLKAILRWTKAVDAQAVRTLFDRMVRSGYPLDDSFPPGVVPFRTDAASGEHFVVPEVATPISYSAHVVPLYKMFIKALYVRRDVEGAKVVVGILKRLEAKERLRRGQRVLVAFRRKRR